MTVRHKSSRACRALRVAAHDGIEAGCLAGCLRAGRHSTTAVIRAFVAGEADAELTGLTGPLVLADECIDDAVGAVVVYRINAGHLAHWGGRDPEYARPEHLCTLIVSGAVNVDEWKKEIPLIEEWFDFVGEKLPTGIKDEFEALKQRLNA